MLPDSQLHREPHSLDASLWSSWPDTSGSCTAQFFGGTHEDDMTCVQVHRNTHAIETNCSAAAPRITWPRGATSSCLPPVGGADRLCLALRNAVPQSLTQVTKKLTYSSKVRSTKLHSPRGCSRNKVKEFLISFQVNLQWNKHKRSLESQTKKTGYFWRLEFTATDGHGQHSNNEAQTSQVAFTTHGGRLFPCYQ